MTRTVLVTGGAGFIGSNLARWLAARGDRVRILDDLSIGQPAYLAGTCPTTCVRGVARGPGGGPRRPWPAWTPSSTWRRGPASTTRCATRSGRSRPTWPGRSRLLEAARLAGVRRFVFASSNAAAGDHEPPSDETDLPHPLSPYGASKLADRGVRRRLCRDLRPRRLLPALLQRLRAELAAQEAASSRPGCGPPSPASRSRSTATASRPATSSSSTTWRPRSRPPRRARGARGRRAVPGRDRRRDDRRRAGRRRSGGRSGGELEIRPRAGPGR